LVPVVVPSILAGISIAVGLLVIPTAMIFIFILGIYSILQFIWNNFQEKSSEYLLVANSIIALCSLAALALAGIHSPVYSFTTYSIALVHAFIVLLGGTVLFYFYSRISRKKPLLFVGLVVFTIVLALGIVIAFNGGIPHSVFSPVKSFFVSTYKAFSIEELEPWSLAEAWADFNIGIILSIVGFIVLAITTVRKKSEIYLFVLVWGIIVIFATIRYSRFEYFSAVIVTIYSAFALGIVLGDEKAPPVIMTGKSGSGAAKKKKDSIWGKKSASFLLENGKYVVLGCVIVFCGLSLISDYSIVTVWTRDNQIPSQWIDTLKLIEEDTPDPGVSYLGPYSPKGWQYPPDSYGILSSWDYGHWITFLGKRIPVTNPFQDNIRASYTFFFTESEETANRIADSLGIRYVIVDWKMADTKFQPTIPLYNKSLKDHYYFESYLIPELSGTSWPTTITLVNQPYYFTMISRLYNSDGSLATPGKVIYVEYSPSSATQAIPVISKLEQMDYDTALERLLLFNAINGNIATIHGFQLNSPTEEVGALRHYRLVSESTGQDQGMAPNFTNSVKMFEYVKGARLKGEGIIEVRVETNLGRVFVYRQKSENDYFILPYATSSGSYPVHTIGPYRILDSGRLIEVSEQDVIEGKIIG
ncbi:MAG: oligosaccharyl transferase, archaeosortase A system-associated, partial [Candidatus Helarchaeota archaeon]|nr:oligosaccharyl transferase, archaeosortase A system-associated [Candidatus Helarchaeota archaeon]